MCPLNGDGFAKTFIQSLARFLPSLTSVKESKLSKHTIVDESLKYHEVQKTKLEDLQKTVDDLTAEKEALLAELSGWRECLDPEQTVPAQPLEPSAVQNNPAQVSDHDLMPMYSGTAKSGLIAGIEIPAMPSAGYDIPAEPVSNLMSDAQLLNNYTLQTPRMSFSNEPGSGVPPRIPQYSIPGVAQDEPQHTLWGTEIQQPLWTQAPYQELPLEFQHHGF